MKPFLVAVLLCVSLSLNADEEWRAWGTQSNIEVFRRTTQSGYIEIRATTRVETTLSAFIALLHDTERIPEWMDSVSRVTVIEEPGLRNDLVHTLFRSPWPVADRDMVTYSEYFQPTPCSLILEVSDRHADLPELENHVRMFDVRTSWTVQIENDGHTTINYLAYANPSGNLPKWIANQATLKATVRTLLALRQELAKTDYQEQVVDGVSDCPSANQAFPHPLLKLEDGVFQPKQQGSRVDPKSLLRGSLLAP